MDGSLAIIDFETTGLSPERGDRVIEAGIAILEHGRVVDRYQSFINPQMRIPAEVVALTGIDDSMVRSAPPAHQVMSEIMAFVGDLPLVAHNASFDRRFMDAELGRIRHRRENPFICSLRVARRVYPSARNHKLATLVTLAGIEAAQRYHRALGDAEMTARLWVHMAETIGRRHGIPAVTLEMMQSLQTCRVSGADEVMARFTRSAI